MSTLRLNPDMRDSEIRQAVSARQADDTKILQKVNAVNREAFTLRFPGQLEHHMRLVSERLQACLSKADITLGNPDTWPASVQEITDLTHALKNLNEIRKDWATND